MVVVRVTDMCILMTSLISSACNGSRVPTSIHKASPVVSVCTGGHDSLCSVAQPVGAVLDTVVQTAQASPSPAAPLALSPLSSAAAAGLPRVAPVLLCRQLPGCVPVPAQLAEPPPEGPGLPAGPARTSRVSACSDSTHQPSLNLLLYSWPCAVKICPTLPQCKSCPERNDPESLDCNLFSSACAA